MNNKGAARMCIMPKDVSLKIHLDDLRGSHEGRVCRQLSKCPKIHLDDLRGPHEGCAKVSKYVKFDFVLWSVLAWSSS